MFNILLSIFVCAAGSLFFSLAGECTCFRAVCHCWKYDVVVVDVFLKACSKFSLDEVAVLGEYSLSGCHYFLKLLVLVFVVSVAIYLSQVDVVQRS